MKPHTNSVTYQPVLSNEVKFLAQGNNGSLWWGTNSQLSNYKSEALPIGTCHPGLHCYFKYYSSGGGRLFDQTIGCFLVLVIHVLTDDFVWHIRQDEQSFHRQTMSKKDKYTVVGKSSKSTRWTSQLLFLTE